MTNRGKDFEGEVRNSIEKVDGVYILRLYDPQGGYLSVANPCDFIAYKKPTMYMLECKSHKGNTLPIYSNDPKKKYGVFTNTQWEGMLNASEKGIVAGAIVWWIDRDVTKFIPIDVLQHYRDMGMKSIRYDDPFSAIFPIKGTKKRIYFDYDFTEFFNIFGGS